MEIGKEEYLFNRFKRDYLFYFSRFLNRVKVEPDMIQIMLTSKCNVRCKICDVWRQQFREELTTEEVKNLISQAIDMGIKTVYFTGGEALLRKDIFELIDHASRPGIITTVNTNGSLITEEMARKIVSSKLRNITFSIDSANPKIHNSIRGKDVFKKAIKAIEFINYYKKRFHRESSDGEERGLDVGMVSVIMKCNIKEPPQLVNLAKKLQCCYIAFQPLVYNGSLLENINFKSDFWLGEEDILKLKNTFQKLELIKREMLTKGLFVDFMPERTIQYFKKERRVNTCFAGFSRVFVNPQGDISFVCFESFGNVKRDSLKEAWLSKEAYLIREKIKVCRVNCTQFCSERPQSENINLIHNQLAKEIDSIFKSEYSFLQSIKEEADSVVVDKNEDVKKGLNELENAMDLIKRKINGNNKC